MQNDIRRRYIVVFNDDVSTSTVKDLQKELEAHDGVITNTYDSSIFKGFAAVIPDEYFTHFQNDFASEIKFIEKDSIVTTQ